MATWVRTGIGVLAWLATAVGGAGIALHFSRSTSRPLVLAASGVPYLLVGALVGLVLFAVARYRIGAAVAAVVVAVAVWTQAPLYIGDAEVAEGPVVTVMQANILFDGGADPEAVVAEVRDRNVDVLTVDELTPAGIEGLARMGLDERLPHRYLVPGELASGTGIWSRFPLSDTAEYDGFVLRQISATATVPEVGPVTVFAFHPVPPVFGTKDWSDELSGLRSILDRSHADRPAIVGGDFNATYDHSQYRALLSGRFDDVIDQVGAGNLRTYPTDKRLPPVVGIDRILVADGTATAVEVVDLPGADHRALVAQIRLDSSRP